MEKVSAQNIYLHYLRGKYAADKEAASCGDASKALAKHYKKLKDKKATITKEADTPWSGPMSPEMYQHAQTLPSFPQNTEMLQQILEGNEYDRQLSENPMLIDKDTQQRLLAHNKGSLRTAGGLLGAGTGLLGGGGIGAGVGALAAGAGKRMRGSGYGALAGGAAGALLGGLVGPSVGERSAEKATQKDVGSLNQLAQQQAMGLGLSPFGHGDLEGMKAKATFGENTGDPRAFALEELYRNMPQS